MSNFDEKMLGIIFYIICTTSFTPLLFFKQDADGNKEITYKKPCHEPCKLPFVQAETVNSYGILFCRRIRLIGGTCKECNHSWKAHMQMTYELKKKDLKVIDKSKQKLLNENQSSKAALDDFIDSLKIYIDELKFEQALITKICAQFGCYLKENAISPFNDAVDSHLDMLIWQEKARHPPIQSAIKRLENMKEKYQKEKSDICRAMGQSNSSNIQYILEPGKVNELQLELFGLKHNGESLREIFEANRRARDERYSTMVIEPIQLVPHRVRGMYKYIKKNVQGAIWQANKSL